VKEKIKISDQIHKRAWHELTKFFKPYAETGVRYTAKEVLDEMTKILKAQRRKRWGKR